MTAEQIASANAVLRQKSALEVLRWAISQANGRAIVSTNFRPYRNGLRRRAKHLYKCMIADRARLILAASSVAIMSACHTFGVMEKARSLPRDPSVNVDSLFAAFSDGIFQEAKKDWKGFKQGEVLKDTQNGMAVRAQKIDGSMESAGGELEGLVILIDSPKPLGIFGQRTKKHSDLLEKESTSILDSIKKISSNPGVGHED